MDFRSLSQSVFYLYRERRYEEGFSLIGEARPSLPDQDNRLTFWEPCLWSMSDDPSRALEVLVAGTDRGLWRPAGMLEDHDLDAARALSGWGQVVSACREAEAVRLAERPPVRVRPGSGRGTVVALHGDLDDPTDFARSWEAAATNDLTVITPVGGVPVPNDGWSWSHNQSSRISSVLAQLEGFSTTEPLILAGFSAGGTLAIELAVSELGPDGLLLVAPYVEDSATFSSSLESLRVPVVLTYGTEDPEAEQYRQLRAAVTDVFVAEGLGHRLPDDLASILDNVEGLVESSR